MTNILENAVTATVDPCRLWITSQDLERDGRRWHAIVLGNFGSHVPESERERIFEAFYTKRGAGKAGGTGLGLAIAKKIVTDHGGEVACVSGSGPFTEIHLRLPVRAVNLHPSIDAQLGPERFESGDESAMA